MNEFNNYQPVPTEYKGILFKSKSEAVFARCLDIWGEKGEGQIVSQFEYEPKQLILDDGYVPDFYFSFWSHKFKESAHIIIFQF